MTTPPFRLRIDRAALAANWRRVAETARPATCAAVVKADAYGLGLAAVVPVLLDVGCSVFFVATPAEGVKVREMAPAADIYVLDGLVGTCEAYSQGRLRPVLGNREELKEWTVFRRKHGSAGELAAALHVDTGMNRLGLSMTDLDEFDATGGPTPAAEAAGLCLVMSHFACADTPDHPLNRAQMERFAAVRSRFSALPGSLANSAGVFLGEPARHDLVRPGIALYGGASHPDATMAPVVTAEALVLQVRSARAGETVGYGGDFTLKRDSRLAILAAGYADGYLRSAGSADDRPGARVALGGHFAPVVGRVSMDLIAADVTDLPDGVARRGAYAELFGPTVAIDEVADQSGTIAYELLTGLSRRAVREVVDGAATGIGAGGLAQPGDAPR